MKVKIVMRAKQRSDKPQNKTTIDLSNRWRTRPVEPPKRRRQGTSGGEGVRRVDAAKEIRRAVDTGKVLFGTKGSEKSLKNGTAKLLVVAANCQKLAREKLVSFAEISKTPHHGFQGTGLELGSICGKPFTISAMVVQDEGKSKVLEIAKK